MAERNYRTLTAAVVTMLYLAMIIVNALANALPINDLRTGDVSALYPNLFTPAGITFSIWGLIYFLLGLYMLYQWGLFADTEVTKEYLMQQVRLLFIISSVANIAWIFAWHYQFIWLSVLLMMGLLIPLILISVTLRGESLSRREKLFLRLPFSVYFGWITVATVANITALLTSIKWDRFGIDEQNWAAAMLVVAAIIGSIVIIWNRDIAYGLVLIWAFSGILYKHVDTTKFNWEYPTVIGADTVCLLALVAALAVAAFKIWRQPNNYEMV